MYLPVSIKVAIKCLKKRYEVVTIIGYALALVTFMQSSGN